MEASTLSHAARRGLLTRKSPLLKLKGDEQLVAMVRAGNPGAFDIIVDRYQGRLLGFCRQMIGSTEDAEDVLQEVFLNAHKAMLADNREINLKPWLYRIARNRSLNHLRRPKADAQESMDMVPMVEAGSTAEKVHNREEFRQLLNDVTKLPETQRAALLLREIDALSYEEIAEAMDTSVPSVKSLLVRARISLAEASQARMLTCGEVRVELAEAAEGLTKVEGPVRRHVRDCEECAAFRKQLRDDSKVLAMIMPVGPILALKAAIGAKLGFGGSAGTASTAGTAGTAAGTTAGAAGAATGTTAAGAAAAGTTAGAAIGAGGAAGGIGALSSAIGLKAVAGVVTAAVITAGAVEVSNQVAGDRPDENADNPGRIVASAPPPGGAGRVAPSVPAGDPGLLKAEAPVVVEEVPVEIPAVEEAPADAPADAAPPVVEEVVAEVPVVEEAPAEAPPADGLEGEVVEVPNEVPPPDVDPTVPSGESPETVGQTLTPPTTPPAPPSDPTAPATQTPAPAPPVPDQGEVPPTTPQS
jgi:RNA polymerase sigma factor (sigma-70 family)